MVGTSLSILLTLFVCILWRYIIAHGEKKFEEDEKRKKSMPTVVGGFTVPMTYRTVRAQTPFISREIDQIPIQVIIEIKICECNLNLLKFLK